MKPIMGPRIPVNEFTSKRVLREFDSQASVTVARHGDSDSDDLMAITLTRSALTRLVDVILGTAPNPFDS